MQEVEKAIRESMLVIESTKESCYEIASEVTELLQITFSKPVKDQARSYVVQFIQIIAHAN
ncbi:hypothetical protein CCR75_002752 [Bremia lactucae]|uniref:Uncharacterized protein n=1 Tax=Bremia lactucae TaxID=4779 RepID=A0A976IIX4_BRELC|nr:hypothetical protein CCR75_002752 [Bremia lactucae]